MLPIIEQAMLDLEEGNTESAYEHLKGIRRKLEGEQIREAIGESTQQFEVIRVLDSGDEYWAAGPFDSEEEAENEADELSRHTGFNLEVRELEEDE